MKRIIWLITCVVVSVGLVVTVRAFRSAQHSRVLVSEFESQSKKLDAEIHAAREQLATHTHTAEVLLADLQQAQNQKEKLGSLAIATPPPVSKGLTATSRRELSDLLEKNPDLRALFKQSFKANLAPSYQSLYTKAHLSPQQIDNFEEFMTEAEQDRLDLLAAAKTQGLAANDPALAQMRQQADEKLQSAQKEILGDAGYQELQRFNRQRPLRNFTASLAGLVAQSGEPLAAPQCDQLLDILSSTSHQYLTGGRAELMTVDPKIVIQEAKPILTQVQFSALQANANFLELMKLSVQFYQQKKAAAK